MSRALLLAAGFVAVDQLTKTAAGVAFPDGAWMIADGWGLTHVVNRGVYIWPDIPGSMLTALHGVALVSWLAGVLALRWYQRSYRSSLLVDLAFACLTVATLGNLIDRVLVGGARDWAITPIAIGNLADASGWFVAGLVLAELAVHAPARRLLSLNPLRWRPGVRQDDMETPWRDDTDRPRKYEDMTTAIPTQALEHLIDRIVGRRGIRHAVIAVESGDGITRAVAARGSARPDGAPMEPDTPFHYTSVTKLYTAATVMRLWEQNRVDLDASIATYLPSRLTHGLHRLKGVDRSAAITVRHLLSHTSGLPDYFLAAPPGRPSFAERIEAEDFAYTLDDVLDAVRRLKPHFPPQEPAAPHQRARYADTNFQLLGAVIAAVTGQTYEDAVETQILEPVGLRDTWFTGRPRAARSPVPSVMWSGDTVLERPQAMASMAPEGGLIGTVADALTFMRSLIRGDLFDREETLAAMRARWNRFGVPRNREAMMAPAWPIEYGLGVTRFRLPRLFNLGRRSPTLIGHTGASGSWLFWCPDDDIYVAGTVDQTTAAPEPYRLAPRLLRLLHDSR